MPALRPRLHERAPYRDAVHSNRVLEINRLLPATLRIFKALRAGVLLDELLPRRGSARLPRLLERALLFLLALRRSRPARKGRPRSFTNERAGRMRRGEPLKRSSIAFCFFRSDELDQRQLEETRLSFSRVRGVRVFSDEVAIAVGSVDRARPLPIGFRVERLQGPATDAHDSGPSERSGRRDEKRLQRSGHLSRIGEAVTA